MGLGARWHEIAAAYADVNCAFGDIVKVTPSSKVVGDMAIFLVSHGMTMEQFEELPPDHGLIAAPFGDRYVRGLARRSRRRLAAEDLRRSFSARASRSEGARAPASPMSISTRPRPRCDKSIGTRAVA